MLLRRRARPRSRRGCGCGSSTISTRSPPPARTGRAAPLTRYDADPDFYLALAASRPTFVRPHAVVVERDGGPRRCVVARVEDTRLPDAVRLRRAAAAAGALDHDPVRRHLGATDELAPLLIRELRKPLAAGAADVLCIPALRDGLAAAPRRARGGPGLLREPHVPVGTHRRLELADSYQEFLRSRSKSSRESAKRYRKKVDRELGDRLELRIYRDPADIDTIFADTEPVAAQTYQRALGVALADTPQQRALIEVGLRRGWFRCYVAYLDGRPIAFWPGYAYDGTFYIGTPGYDPASRTSASACTCWCG